jgi:hypothetical protein
VEEHSPSRGILTSVVLAAALYAFLWHVLDRGSEIDQLVVEHHKTLQSCERNTAVAVAALNGWQITEGSVRVACRRVRW